MSSVPVLSLIVFLPLIGALGVAVLPRTAGWSFALLSAIADLVLSLALLTQFSDTARGFQFSEHLAWLPDLGISYSLGVDGINLYLLALNALLTCIALGASWNLIRASDRPKQYLILMLLLSTGMQGVFLATNLFLFYIFWELMLVPAYLLVGSFGGANRAYAAIKFVLYTTVGSLLMLVGIIALGAEVSSTAHQAYSLDLSALLRGGVTTLPLATQIPLFLAFAAAFAVKSGLFPLHSWAPDAYSESPIPVAVLVAGVMAKTGVYGFLRYCIGLFPGASRELTGLMSTLAVIGILYFALQAVVATDFLRLLAYVSLSHMSVIVLGLFALNAQGIEGGVVQMVNHGIVIAALFLIAGYIELRTGARRLAEFGGLAARLPWLATVFCITALSALGLPGLNSFAGEFLAFIGAFRASVVFGALGTLVVIPAAWYMLRFFQGVMHGPATGFLPASMATRPAAPPSTVPVRRTSRTKTAAKLPDLRASEFLALAPLLILIVYLGVAPGVLTARMEQSVRQMPPISVAAPVAPLSPHVSAHK